MAEFPLFGKAMRKAYFNFDEDYIPLNHGSFGTYPTPVRNRLHFCQRAAEARPDTFIRYELPLELDASREAIASFLKIPAEEVVFAPNASTGINVVVRSLQYERGDVIVYFSTIYGACEKTVEYLCESTSVDSQKIDLEYPMTDDKLIQKFEETLESLQREGRKARVAIFDVVSSLPSVLVPWERLVQSCKDHNVLSLVDGAHGIGHIPLEHLGEVKPDFLVSNCHKWLFVPRGCAILHVPVRNQHLIRTSLPTSHGFKALPRPGRPSIFNPMGPSDRSDFVEMFQYTATVDASPYLCVQEALKFRREICGGEEKIMRYCSKLAEEGGKHAAAILGTSVMGNHNGTCFVSVKLPLEIGNGEGKIKKSDIGLTRQWIVSRLVEDYKTYIEVYIHADTFWARFSCQVYLELDEILWGAKVLQKLCQQTVTENLSCT